MSHHEDYPENIVVDWCVTARVKGKGKPHVNVTMGGGVEATNEMIGWLEGLDVDGGGKVSIGIEADLTSEQVERGSENFRFSVSGLPAEAARRYAIEWLAAVGPLEGWGSGGP